MSKKTDKISVIGNVPVTGNDILHRLTLLKPRELRIDIERFNEEKAFVVYSSFSVVDEASKYGLQLGEYIGNAVKNTLKETLQ